MTTPGGADAVRVDAIGALYGPIIETTTDAIVITDARRRITFANRAAAALFAMDIDRLVGSAVEAITASDQLEEVARRERLALGGEPQWYETVILRSDGERRTVSVSSAPLRNDHGTIGVVASLRDVTEERRARDAVVQSEARYRNLFESATDAIYTMDTHGNVTSANPATCAITGFSVDDLLGRSMTTIVPAEELEVLRENFRTARAGIACRYEAHFIRADGERRLASVTNTPIYRAGEIVGVMCLARDITEERQRELDLRSAHMRYQRLVESAWDAIFSVDGDGRFTSVNEALESGLGIPRDRLLQMRFLEVVEPDDRAALQEVHAAVMRGERQRAELRFRDAHGEVRVGSLTLTPLNDDAPVMSALGIVRDVTDERRLTEQLFQREKLAAVGQLVSGVAHELNNPLAGILAFSQLLMASSQPDRAVRDAVVTINKEAKRAAKIISNLLLFARQRPPERARTDLNQVVLDALELRRYALRTHQVELRTELDPNLPMIRADGAQLQQVLLNLITNAEHALRDHAGPKRLTISTRHAAHAIMIMVSDTGPGVPAEVQDRIFNPFFSTKKVGEGTGLGLSISDGIVREHGGQIRLTSGTSGATFVIELPEGTPDEARPAPAADAGRLRLLLVGPPAADRDAIASCMERAGHEVAKVRGRVDALARIGGARYDALLIDLRAAADGGRGEGEGEGEAVYAALLDREPRLAAHVVFLIGDAETETQRQLVRRSGRPAIRAPQPPEAIAEMLYTEARRR